MEVEPVIGLGFSDVIAGVATTGALTVKLAEFDATLFALITFTVHVRAVVPVTIEAWICVALTLRIVSALTAPPEYVACTVSPVAKPVPVIVNVWLEAEPVMGLGLNDVIAGIAAGAFTVRLAEFETALLELATCTVQTRAVVPVLIVATICVAVNEVTVNVPLKPV